MMRRRFRSLPIVAILAFVGCTFARNSSFAQTAPQAQGKEGLKTSASDYAALKSTADALYARGDYTQAVAVYQEALRVAP